MGRFSSSSCFFLVYALIFYETSSFSRNSLLKLRFKVTNNCQLEGNKSKCFPLKMSESESERLLRQAKEAREEIEKMESDLAKYKLSNPNLTKKREENKPIKTFKAVNFEQIMTKLSEAPVLGQEATKQIEVLENLKSQDVVQLWKSATTDYFPVTLPRMTSQTGIKGEDLSPTAAGTEADLRFSLIVVCVGSFILAAASGIVIGGNVGATMTYLFAILPILFLGVGSTAPGLITATIENLKTRTDSNFVERRIVHEAAHFFVGYVLGFPIKSYQTANDLAEVEFYDTPEGEDFFSKENPQLSKTDLLPLAVVAMAGVVGECLKFANARGGQNDLATLQRLFTRTKPYIRSDEQMDITRWGVVTAHKILKENPKQVEALIEAFRDKKELNECIAIIEAAGSTK